MMALHIIVKGKVQGVFYRSTAAQMAKNYSLVGYAKNLKDGDVEIVAQGNEANLDEFVKWCWQGSKSAKVMDVIVKKISSISNSDFKIF